VDSGQGLLTARAVQRGMAAGERHLPTTSAETGHPAGRDANPHKTPEEPARLPPRSRLVHSPHSLLNSYFIDRLNR
jgi:hypothetical protein